MTQFIVTKKIAKHGKQAILVIPKILQDELQPGTIVQATFDIIRKSDKNSAEVKQ